jgi:hypothetical protein
MTVMKVLDGIDDKLARWLLDQPVFFVASAPSDDAGHVNVSPKGMAGTFAILDKYKVAYLDYYGSGAETIAHLRDNGRITVMFMAFTGRPTIIRLYGLGRIIRPDDAEFAQYRGEFEKERETAQRSIIVIDVDRVSSSCGYSVPVMEFVADRDILDLHQEKKGAAAYEHYDTGKNAVSIDGLPALIDL